MSDDPSEIRCSDVELRPESSDEWGFTVAATARVTGPAGERRISRRYEALPRHNDVVEPETIDSNDELVDRPDAIHVHTELYGLDDGDEAYLRDAHDTWVPDDASVLETRDAFLAACREHFLANVGGAYETAS